MIRPYRESDLEAVVSLFTESVHGLAAGHYDATQLSVWAPRPPDLDAWGERLGRLQTLVAEAEQGLAGFISYEANGHIDLLYTSAAQSRRGVASALYAEAETILRRAGVSELSTEASIVARPFFESVGFSVLERQDVWLRGATFRRYAMRRPLIAAGSGADERLQPGSTL